MKKKLISNETLPEQAFEERYQGYYQGSSPKRFVFFIELNVHWQNNSEYAF